MLRLLNQHNEYVRHFHPNGIRRSYSCWQNEIINEKVNLNTYLNYTTVH